MNKETFKQTYLPLSASMYRTAYRILGNPEDAEDMVQEAYMKLWKQRDILDGILDARAYAVTSVKNLCLDTIRKRHLSYENYGKTERTMAAASTPYQRPSTRKKPHCCTDISIVWRSLNTPSLS